MEVDLQAQKEIEERKDVSSGINADAAATEAKEQKIVAPEPDVNKAETDGRSSENARRRREAERQRELREVRLKAVIETLGGKNPYTGEDITDEADVQEYFTMRDISARGGDPLSDFASQRKREEKARLEHEKKAEKEAEWYREDKEKFSEKYPDVSVSDLSQDETFINFAGGKIGNVPLVEIYEEYQKLTAALEKKSKEMATRMVANAQASPGKLSSGNPPDDGYFTREQVRKMSPEEVHTNYEKIRKSMSKWR